MWGPENEIHIWHIFLNPEIVQSGYGIPEIWGFFINALLQTFFLRQKFSLKWFLFKKAAPLHMKYVVTIFTTIAGYSTYF